jgi:hypothetical protein
MDLHVIEINVEGYVAGVQEVIGEILLDNITFVTTADNEFIDAVVAIGFQDVPEDGLASHLHHRLGPQVGFLGETGAKAAGKDNGFHVRPGSACAIVGELIVRQGTVVNREVT